MVTFSKRIMRAAKGNRTTRKFWVMRSRTAGREGRAPTGPLRVDSRSAPLEERLDQAVEVPVEHRLHVAGLVPGAFVLHELVRLHRVRADLTPEVDAALLPRQLLELRALVLALLLGQARCQDLHRLRL